MTTRGTLFALALVVTAVVLQTTLFVGNQLSAFGVVPDLVMLAVIAGARHLDPEPAILLGFSGGLLSDLLGLSPLGLWALVLTVVAYVTVRIRHMAEDHLALAVLGVGLLTLAGTVLYVLVATLFGLRPLQSPLLARILLLTPLYNAVLAVGFLPITGWLLTARRRSRRGVLA